MQTARDQLITAAAICPDERPDLLGRIGRAVMDTLLPARRVRYSARTLKCGTSRYRGHDPLRPEAATAITAIDITLHTPGLTERPAHRRKASAPTAPTRRQRITAIMNTERHRSWSGRELADRLGIKPRIMLTQLAEWARYGFLTRTGPGTYAQPEPP
ncbi:hypothetical protein ABN028_20340 [Actinopolymorpha sp. B17G11]|uniref:hypothetical protein n=1 Tax=Actinopolymorpha sp. B17G11 TaxID=3160861 RepID=UPI0032E44982